MRLLTDFDFHHSTTVSDFFVCLSFLSNRRWQVHNKILSEISIIFNTIIFFILSSFIWVANDFTTENRNIQRRQIIDEYQAKYQGANKFYMLARGVGLDQRK